MGLDVLKSFLIKLRPLAAHVPLAGHWPLIQQLVKREVLGRYRGAALGALWSLLTPLLMLAIYTFVFGAVFKAKWTPPAGTGGATAVDAAAGSTAEFAIILFIGLIVFGIFAEVVTRAPGLVLSNISYVKKIVFPLETLVPVALGAALFHAALSLVVLFAFMLVQFGSVPPTALWLPVVLAPFVVLTLGLGWFLASLGVYMRDIAQVLPPAVNALMFLSPIFFPSSSLPPGIRNWLFLNPVALPIEQARNVLFWRRAPDLWALTVYMAVALAVAMLGYQWFQKTRKGFADVL
jgi:lipopolysaccharide transport system permease protein